MSGTVFTRCELQLEPEARSCLSIRKCHWGNSKVVSFPIQLTLGKCQQPGALPAGCADRNQAVKAALNTEGSLDVPEALLRAAPYC